jgi:hypothetical protein
MTVSLAPLGIFLTMFPLMVAGYHTAVREPVSQTKSWFIHFRDFVYCSTGGIMVYSGYQIIGEYGPPKTRAELAVFPISIIAFTFAAHYIDTYYSAKQRARIHNATQNIYDKLSDRCSQK